MNAGKTLFSQLTDCLPWSTFARLVARYDGDRAVRTLPCTEQFRAMAFAQPTYRESLRDIETCLAAQPSNLRDLIRMSRGMVDLWCQSYPKAPKSIVLDIDDTADIVHGHQQMSFFNAHQDERCFAPIHVYDADTGHCVTTVLRPGKTPSGKEVRGHLRRLVRRIRRHWPKTRLLIRGDSHYGRVEKAYRQLPFLREASAAHEAKHVVKPALDRQPLAA